MLHAHEQGNADLHFGAPEIMDYFDFSKCSYYSKVGDFNTSGYPNVHTKNSQNQSSVKVEVGKFDTERTVALLDLLADNSKK